MILGLSTSSARGSAALLEQTVLAVEQYDDDRAHAERIFATIDAALARAGRARSAIVAVACDVGPGSFTGLRAGIAAAKGIALGLGCPIVGIGSLAAMAAAALARAPELEEIGCTLDAKRGERFVAVYRRAGAEVVLVRPPIHVPADQAVASLGGVAFTDEPPRADWVARLAHERLARGEHDDLGALEPVYLRAPDATPMAPR